MRLRNDSSDSVLRAQPLLQLLKTRRKYEKRQGLVAELFLDVQRSLDIDIHY